MVGRFASYTLASSDQSGRESGQSRPAAPPASWSGALQATHHPPPVKQPRPILPRSRRTSATGFPAAGQNLKRPRTAKPEANGISPGSAIRDAQAEMRASPRSPVRPQGAPGKEPAKNTTFEPEQEGPLGRTRPGAAAGRFFFRSSSRLRSPIPPIFHALGALTDAGLAGPGQRFGTSPTRRSVLAWPAIDGPRVLPESAPPGASPPQQRISRCSQCSSIWNRVHALARPFRFATDMAEPVPPRSPAGRGKPSRPPKKTETFEPSRGFHGHERNCK